MKILLLEDEAELAQSISTFLKKGGHIVEVASSLVAARQALANVQDCVLVDILLPDGNGLDLLRELKSGNPEIGIIIISAKDSVGDKIHGLELGADDYLAKPFHLGELHARIKSLARRKQRQGSTVLECGGIRLHPDSMEALIRGQTLALTPKEFELLLYFMTNRNRVLSKQSLLEHLWENMALGADSHDFIYAHIKNLRRKIFQSGGEDPIKTVYGLGYRFVAEPPDS